MKKEIRQVDKERNVVQITTVDSRWYARPKQNSTTGLPEYEFVPSVTWICDFYPRGLAYFRWLADKGWDNAEAIKNAAGERGSKVHQAVNDLIHGKTVAMAARYPNSTTGQEEELTLEEYEAILSFAAWAEKERPEFVAAEFVVWGDGYAGTVDLVCKIGEETWLIDLKTSQNVWPFHKLQVSAYRRAEKEGLDLASMKLGILQLGYRLNKNCWKFTEVEDHYEEFQAAKTIWAREQKGVSPKQREYPLSVTLQGQKENEDAKHESTEQVPAGR